MTTVVGQERQADLERVVTRTRCRYRDPRKNIPNMPATDSAWIALAPDRVRERKIRSGTRGVRAVDSRDHERDQERQGPGGQTQGDPGAPAMLGRGLDDRVHAEHQRAT